MNSWLYTHHLVGLLIGLATFLIIGLFHPLVIKGYYHFGLKCRWWFLAFGLVMIAVSILSDSHIISILAGVTAFSSFWSIKEIKEQEGRVARGWFPSNPKQKK
ncbi:MAG: DUF4491 family protein [Bacteroidales bacterium]|nr:DUF4491 family protein [Bacteroidales bacterium]MDE6801796.1 DUF4491 family protein [Muribaculaceae bacterium]